MYIAPAKLLLSPFFVADRTASGIVEADVQEKEKKRWQCRWFSVRRSVSSALSPPAPTPVSPPPDPEANARQRSSNAFKSVCERAADLVKSEVASTGKIRPTAIFVYENEAGTPEASTTKMVSLIWNGEIQKEALIQRIREKAYMEKASAVLLLAEADPEQRSSPGDRACLCCQALHPA